MSLKTHIAEAGHPLTEGRDLMALCGRQIPKAVFMLRWVSGELTTDSFSTMLFCRICWNRLSVETELHDRYVYGVVAGEEIRENWEKEAC